MKNIRVLIPAIILLLVFNTSISAQKKLKATFKKIEFVTYDLNSPRTTQKDKVEIISHVVINGLGLVKITRNKEGVFKHYKYSLSKNMMKTLNQIFNGEKPLSEYLESAKLDEGTHYAGYYNYISYTTTNNKKDALSFIPPLMSKSINDVLDKIENIVYKVPKKEIPGTNKENKKLLLAIVAEHKKSNYVPGVEMPPPAMQ